METQRAVRHMLAIAPIVPITTSLIPRILIQSAVVWEILQREPDQGNNTPSDIIQ